MEAALHEHFGLAFPDQLHRQVSGGVTVWGIDDLVASNINLKPGYRRLDPGAWPNQDRFENTQFSRFGLRL